jgi:DinB superfamily
VTRIAVATSDSNASAAPLGGEAAHRAAPFVAELDDAMRRLREHAAVDHIGLTRPVPGEAERWEAAQVWAHMAEFGDYWLEQLSQLLNDSSTGPVSFGRTRHDEERIAAIERGRSAPAAEHLSTIERSAEDLRLVLAHLTVTDWQRIGTHPTLGQMDVARFLDEFLVGHYSQHADQLDELLGDGTASSST